MWNDRDAGNRLLRPDEIASEALRIHKENVRFTRDYDIESGRRFLRADYRVPAHYTTPKGHLPALGTAEPFTHADLLVEREWIPEIHHATAVDLIDIKDEEIPEVEDMLVHALERHANGA